MRAVLGVDAAWTVRNTSSVVGRALVAMYPHPALIELCGGAAVALHNLTGAELAATRTEPQDTVPGQWRSIVDRFDPEISGMPSLALPSIDALLYG